MPNIKQEELENLIGFQFRINNHKCNVSEELKTADYHSRYTTTPENHRKFINYLNEELPKYFPEDRVQNVLLRILEDYGLTFR